MKASYALLFAFCFAAAFSRVRSQECGGWVPYNGKCWYFSDGTLDPQAPKAWLDAESWCQTNHGHLASYANIDERDWAYNNYLINKDDTRWWIGLTDNKQDQNFYWVDETPYDPTVPDWKIQEPSNSGDEDCVEIWIEQFYPGKWNDIGCTKVNRFICNRDPGDYKSCPIGWTSNTDATSCYRVIESEQQWHYADGECKVGGGQLVSITDANEQAYVATLMTSSYSYWIGLSDTDNPSTLQWSTHEPYSYDNFAAGQPTNPHPYPGSTCIRMTSSGQWTQSKCSVESRFICERGLTGSCPPGWLLLASKCYEVIINENRLQTWTTADAMCKAAGAQLLKIESDQQETFVGNILPQFSKAGYDALWLGASDLAQDNVFAWSDSTPITKFYWDVNMPQMVTGQEDCLSIYTGKSAANWETSTCFFQRAFICELPEGSKLPPGDGVISTEGKCKDTNWRHFNKFCYLVRQNELTQSAAENFCASEQATLTSVLSNAEQSFLVGSMGTDSWMGLTYQSGYRWSDGSNYGSFANWAGTGSTNAACNFMRGDNGEWMGDNNCNTARAFICKMPEIQTPVSTVLPPTGNPTDVEKCGGGGWFSDPSSTQCYLVNAIHARTWYDARKACQTEGGDLLSVNSPQEQNFIHAMVGNVPVIANVWMGANDFNDWVHDTASLVDQGWMWSDGSPFNYLNWNEGEPNNAGTSGEDCGEMYVADGRWNDINCYEYRHYMCEKRGVVNSIIGTDLEDDNCKSNEACCFKHVGVEYGGILDDSALTASSQANEWYPPSRGRLNTPADVIIINDNINFGTGHGAWIRQGSDNNPWLQVDFRGHMEIKGIITQGRNGLIQYTEREWTTKYKISYSQDPNNNGSKVVGWEWLSDANNQPIIFPGNSDQNTQVTNVFPRPIVARHMRCHPVEWKERPALRLEYIGCYASCMLKLGMNSGMVKDEMITASSSLAGKNPQQARAPLDPNECIRDTATDKGASYRGWISKTVSGITCQRWGVQEPHSHSFKPADYPEYGLTNNYCRNPDGEPAPWCYTTDPNVRWQLCNIPTCPNYTPSGWSPSTSSAGQYVQVQFSDFFKVSGVTLYDTGNSYVKRFFLKFSDDGVNFKTYTSQAGADHLFFGLDGTVDQYMDILREPISTKYVRLEPQSWQGSILLQFEVNGCYVEKRITCADKAIDFSESSMDINCPSGCVEDPNGGLVYGTTIYTEHSAICPAAVHAGRVSNDHGGQIKMLKTSGQVSYGGTYSNGITSLDYGASHLSMEFDGSTLRCDEGWRAWRDHCYFLSPKNVLKNWQDSQAECVAMGANLASILSEGENNFIEAFTVQADVGGNIWIGMNDLRTLNYYEWVDDSPVTMTKWMFTEPNGGHERCVNIYRLEGYWNDLSCDRTHAYLCKKDKQLLPPLDPGLVVTDSGCEPGWSGYGASCYMASTDEFMFIYANRICEEAGGKLASVHDHKEQSFIHALVTNTLQPGLGYTSWIGLAAKTEETGGQYYTWETGEIVTYTHWDSGEPDVRFSCAFPFTYKGNTYYECTTVDHPARLENTPWCSTTPEYRGGWINCGNGYEYGCTYMDDDTGYWRIDICGQNRYYVCEKDRLGYTQVDDTTPPTTGSCAPGWYGDTTTSYCYQINEYSDDDRSNRRTWYDSVNHCRDQGGDLVSIHSDAESAAISAAVVQGGVWSYTYFWMGLNDIDLEGGYQWTDGSPVEYTNWALDEPNNHGDTEHCVESQFYEDFSQWNDLNCDAFRNWICKIPKGVTPNPPPTNKPPMGHEDQVACGADETWIRFQTASNEDKCYAFINDPNRQFGWQYSENECQRLGGNLVAIHGDDENTFVLSRAVGTNAEKLWIGLRDIGDRAFYWSDNTPLDYTNWGPGEPNNFYDSEGCVEFTPDNGLWNDDNCGVKYGFICEKIIGSTGGNVDPTPPVTGNCPEGYTEYGNMCYIVGGDNYYDFYTARQWCTNDSSDLAVIGNEYEQAFLNNFLWGQGSNFWIGLWDRDLYNGKFVWVDQSEVSYTNWAQGEPSVNGEGCVEMMANKDGLGTWNDLSCLNNLKFVCGRLKSNDVPPQNPTVSPIECPEGYYSNVPGESCYKLVTSPLSWSAARDMCQSEGNGIDIVSMDEIYDNDLLKSWFWKDITQSDTLWLGMQFVVVTYENGVTETTFSWADGWPNSFTNWAVGEPSEEAIGQGSGCVVMNKDGTWSAVPTSGAGTSCASAMPYVCKKTMKEMPTAPPLGDGNCDPGSFQYDQYCYYVQFGTTDSTSRSWFESAYSCEERGGVLASFHSHDEVQAVVQAITGQNSHNLFIGLSTNGFDGWKWKDGSGVDFFNWADNEPNGLEAEECVEMYPWDGTWNDVSCYEDRGFVCKSPLSYTRCNIHIGTRVDCGYVGITESYCVSSRGCCYDPTVASETFSGCYYPEGTIVGPSGEPIGPSEEPVPSSGLSGGAIAGIIIGVLVLVACVGLGYYFFAGSSDKSVSMPSFQMPWSSSSSSGGAAASSKSSSDVAKGGFDNPMALGDDGQFHTVA